MRQRLLAARAATAVALGLLAMGEAPAAWAAPQTSLPDATLTIVSPGPPAVEIRESFPFDAGAQEFVADASESAGELDIVFMAVGDPDPSISYELSVLSRASVSRTLSLVFRIPLAPVAPDTVSAALDIDLVDENGGGASLTRVISGQTAVPFQESVGLVGDDVPIARFLNVPLGTEDVLAPGLVELSIGPRPAPSPEPFGSTFDALEVRSRFELSPGDRVTLTGTILLVPEPGIALGLAVLAGGLGLLRSRRTRLF